MLNNMCMSGRGPGLEVEGVYTNMTGQEGVSSPMYHTHGGHHMYP